MSQSQIRHLTLSKIEISPEIQTWIAQFPVKKQVLAKSLLLHLNFVSRDVYSSWLLKTLNNQISQGIQALYAVRKLEEGQNCVWNDAGLVIDRPGVSQGSEDLVYSLIANISRSNTDIFLDHPDISEIRDKKIHNIILIDDSIGSGDRVTGFINSMLEHKTFLSWWSAGFLKFHILSFARTRQSEKRIITNIRGSNHGKRKYPKSSKVTFTSHAVYNEEWLESRWGAQYQEYLDLCDAQTQVPYFFQRGFGFVMANIVFYHSVPDNIPGVIWCDYGGWRALFPGRALPDWVPSLLDSQDQTTEHSLIEGETTLSSEMVVLLSLIKRGVRRLSSIAMRLNCDQKFAASLLERAVILGVLSESHRITGAGLDMLKRSQRDKTVFIPDRSMYIPKSWCAGQATIQPSALKDANLLESTDSTEFSFLVDGEVGQASLERSDAKAATPPLSVIPQTPSRARKRHDTHGPLGSKEK